MITPAGEGPKGAVTSISNILMWRVVFIYFRRLAGIWIILEIVLEIFFEKTNKRFFYSIYVLWHLVYRTGMLNVITLASISLIPISIAEFGTGLSHWTSK
jgi:hypothetical protein